MISPELSMIQRNKERSAVLEAEVAEFLKSGGVIATLQGFSYKPRPYGRMGTAATPAPEPNLPRGHVSDEVVAQIRHMAKTTTITDVSRSHGHTSSRLNAEHRTSLT
ncbi:hypothetical protein ALP36_04279 [Pseudomonas syringae pv. coriandricola]|uniref:Uncharacterized protein n=1 Tax=Pseudomonas syringae pv. coriandricola TaxID=264453 RepID=A0A3M5R9M3_9PSED|nr:hypothetical protein ALP36_04279 [Pseudomonas syringae pv. coriandricola]